METIHIAKELIEYALPDFTIMPQVNSKVIMILNKKNGKIFPFQYSIPRGNLDFGWKYGIRKDIIKEIKELLK